MVLQRRNKSSHRGAGTACFSILFVRSLLEWYSPALGEFDVRPHRRVRTASGSDPINAQLEWMIPSLMLRVLTPEAAQLAPSGGRRWDKSRGCHHGHRWSSHERLYDHADSQDVHAGRQRIFGNSQARFERTANKAQAEEIDLTPVSSSVTHKGPLCREQPYLIVSL